LTFILFDTLLQKQQYHLSRRSKSTPRSNDKNAQIHEGSVYEVLSSKSKQKEEKEDKEAQKEKESQEEKESRKEKIYETKDISTQTFGSDREFDKHLTTYKLRGHVLKNNKRLLESQSQKNNRSIIRNINSGKTSTQKTYDLISTDDRSGQFSLTYSPSKSESGSDAKERALGLWQLLKDEYMNASKSSEAQYTNSDSHNRCSKWNRKVSLPKLQDVLCQLFDQLRDELRDFTEKDQQFLNASLREHLAKTFGITKIFPLYLDHSEFLMWFLDENKCLFL